MNWQSKNCPELLGRLNLALTKKKLQKIHIKVATAGENKPKIVNGGRRVIKMNINIDMNIEIVAIVYKRNIIKTTNIMPTTRTWDKVNSTATIDGRSTSKCIQTIRM